jgi:hypothetical protein
MCRLYKCDNDCGPSAFADYSSGRSTYVFDYQCIGDHSYADPAEYGFDWHAPWHDIIRCGTCDFGVATSDFLETYVGNGDIGNLIDWSVSMFLRFGLVGVQGLWAVYENGQFRGRVVWIGLFIILRLAFGAWDFLCLWNHGGLLVVIFTWIQGRLLVATLKITYILTRLWGLSLRWVCI